MPAAETSPEPRADCMQPGADQPAVVACSVDLTGLHMASDHDFNRKSFTTGHTGFGIPFATWPDRVDVPRNAARSLRYMDEYQLVTQGEVFYITELLTKIEGLERGPAGNISLTAAVIPGTARWTRTRSSLSRKPNTPAPASITTASSPLPAKMVSKCAAETPADDVPGKTIIIPEHLEQVQGKVRILTSLRRHLPGKCRQSVSRSANGRENDYAFLAADIKKNPDWVKQNLPIQIL